MKDDVKANLTMNIATNFAFETHGEVSGVDALSDANTYMDTRMALVSYNSDFKNLDWYTNYLKTAAYFARRNPKAYPQYLIHLGYIPVVYMPSCVGTVGIKYMSVLDALHVPYIRMKATSFVVPYYQSDAVDAWASKLQLAEYFNVAPESVRSVDVVRRLFGNG